MNLKNLICPKSIAVVGASDRPGSFGCNAAINSVKSHTDKVYYVNPRKPEILGRRTYATLAELPEPVDCVMICTPQKAVLDIVRQAAALGAKSAVVFASGFSEEHTPEGIAAENEMLEIAEKAGMVILGPNCAGMLNNVDKVNLWGMNCTFDMETRHTGIGVLAQSGFIAMSIMGRAGLNLSYVISSGNGKMIQLEDYLDYMIEDDSVHVISLYLEGVRDSVKFTRCLRKAAEKRKPVVLLKAGKSTLGAQAASSHTGNLAGSTASYQAVFKKYGVVEVDCLEEMICLSQMFSVFQDNMPTQTGVFGLNSSGGANTICADLSEMFHLELPELTEEQKAEITKFIPGFAVAHNPLDVTTALFGDVENMYGVLRVIEGMDHIGVVTIGNSIDVYEGKVSAGICDAVIESRKRGLKKPYLMVPSVEATPSPRYKELLEQNEIVLMSSAKTAYQCIERFMDFVKYQPEKHNLAGLGRPVTLKSQKTVSFTEYQAKQKLKELGINVGDEVIVKEPSQLKDAVKDMAYPLAMKISSKDILHKTDCGGVKLNVSEDAINTAFEEIMANAAAHCPSADIDGVLVGSMAKPGTEIILGIQNDAQFGPILLAGLGGIFVEIFRDVVLAPCPVSFAEAKELLRSLKGYPLLKGYRGSKPKDIDALAELMVKVSELAVAEKDLQEMDLNPVFVYEEGEGIQVIDSLMVFNE